MGSNLKDKLKLLKTWRENNERKSMATLHVWFMFSNNDIKNLGKDRHQVLEQVLLAALDCRDEIAAECCIEELNCDFPNSMRLKVYQAMYLEARGEFETAMDLLNQIITQDENNSMARKRKVAVLKAQAKNSEAIKELTEYLKIFMADTEAWQELSDLYITEQDFNKAAFCVEELILHNPHNHLLHQRYADIKYTQGGQENIDIAKSYYCQAIKLNPQNIRALYGLYLSATSIAFSTKSWATKKKESAKLAEWALSNIQKRYKDIGDDLLNERLDALQIN